MCGITGVIDPSRTYSEQDLVATATKMAATLQHRGPDRGGVWTARSAGIALGFRRLAIVDLSDTGDQPMVSSSGRFVIVFNGEIYNHVQLRTDLVATGSQFRGTSDTEVMLEAISCWGLDKALERFNGMFAFAVWDMKTHSLHLAIDRIGEKPLYWAWCGDTFIFGSELKALRAHPDFRPELDRDALTLFLRYGNVPAPFSIYKGVSKVLAGSVAEIHPGERRVNSRRYWSLSDVATNGLANPLTDTRSEIVARTGELLTDAVRIRMIADVPLGAFLSGGVDSSTVVALMAAATPRPVKTFTVGFELDTHNEAQHAAAVAAVLGTEHTEIYVTAADAMAIVPQLPTIYDEPFADTSQIPTFLVSALARRSVTVTLSGDGGDEVFGGYNRYRIDPLLKRLRRLPHPLRTASASALKAFGSPRLGAFIDTVDTRMPRPLSVGAPAQKLQKLADLLSIQDLDEVHKHLISHWQDPEALVAGGKEPETQLSLAHARPLMPSASLEMMYLDMLSYLPDGILVKLDRASMAVSLEARAPYLDHRLIELAWRIPHGLRVGKGPSKPLLRSILDKHVPSALVDRPKMGFTLPVHDWLRGPLRAWAEDLLDPALLKRQGYLDPIAVQDVWQRHLKRKENSEDRLWAVLMFQAWSGTQPN
jgi:asparagine synthase (glutamine-hydrolysing)